MTTPPIEHGPAMAQTVHVTGNTLAVDLTDGRSISVPLAWYPRLARGTATERANWRVIGQGEGIHWPDLDEDISVDNPQLLAAGESRERSWRTIPTLSPRISQPVCCMQPGA